MTYLQTSHARGRKHMHSTLLLGREVGFRWPVHKHLLQDGFCSGGLPGAGLRRVAAVLSFNGHGHINVRRCASKHGLSTQERVAL